MPPKAYAQGKSSPFGDSALVEQYKRMYGDGVDPIPVLSILPDLRQPRRVIPSSVRGEWDGSPDGLPEVLGNWHALVEDRLGQAVEIENLLKSIGDGEPELSGDPIIDAYARLVSLAASIYKDGLEQPIAVVRAANQYRIVWGERRWVAFALLMLHVDGKYDAIPAVVKPKADVWQQAAENGARAPLNAIGMARQLALLIMDMYQDGKEARFDDYDFLVLPGECDRTYYAQVANGNVYRIPKGMGQRVLDVTGLSSMETVRKYRGLLSIPDALWSKADEQGWSQTAIYDYLESTKGTQSEALTSEHTVRQRTVSQNPDSAALTGGEGETALDDDLVEWLEAAYGALSNTHGGWHPAAPEGTPGQASQADLIARGYLETSQRPRPIDKKLMTEVRITQNGVDAFLRERQRQLDALSGTKHWGLSNGTAFWRRVQQLGIDSSTVLERLQPGAKYLTDLRLTKQYTWERLEMLSPLPVADDPLTQHQADEDEALANLVEGDAAGFKPGALVLTAGGIVLEVLAADETQVNAQDWRGRESTHFVDDVTRIDPANDDLNALSPSQQNDVKYFTSRARTPATDTAVSIGSRAVPDILSRYPKGSYVWHLTQGKVYEVVSYDLERGELVLADPALPDSAPVHSDNPYFVRAATEAEVKAAQAPIPGGLFTQPRQPAPPIDDEDVDNDSRLPEEDGEDDHHEPLGAGGVPLAEAARGETTAAILDAWEDESLAGILKFLHGLAEDGSTAKLRLNELPRISRADIAAYASLPGTWARFVNDTERLVVNLITHQIETGVRAYCEHLRDVGKQLEAARRDE